MKFSLSESDGNEVTVTHLKDPPLHTENCQIINCQFDDEFYLNEPESMEIVRDADGKEYDPQ